MQLKIIYFISFTVFSLFGATFPHILKGNARHRNKVHVGDWNTHKSPWSHSHIFTSPEDTFDDVSQASAVSYGDLEPHNIRNHIGISGKSHLNAGFGVGLQTDGRLARRIMKGTNDLDEQLLKRLGILRRGVSRGADLLHRGINKGMNLLHGGLFKGAGVLHKGLSKLHDVTGRLSHGVRGGLNVGLDIENDFNLGAENELGIARGYRHETKPPLIRKDIEEETGEGLGIGQIHGALESRGSLRSGFNSDLDLRNHQNDHSTLYFNNNQFDEKAVKDMDSGSELRPNYQGAVSNYLNSQNHIVNNHEEVFNKNSDVRSNFGSSEDSLESQMHKSPNEKQFGQIDKFTEEAYSGMNYMPSHQDLVSGNMDSERYVSNEIIPSQRFSSGSNLGFELNDHQNGHSLLHAGDFQTANNDNFGYDFGEKSYTTDGRLSTLPDVADYSHKELFGKSSDVRSELDIGSKHSDLMSKHTTESHLSDDVGLQPDLIMDANLGSNLNGIQNSLLNNEKFGDSEIVGSDFQTGLEQSHDNRVLMSPTESHLEQKGMYQERHNIPNHSDLMSKHTAESHLIDETGLKPGLVLDAKSESDLNGIRHVNLNNENYGESSLMGSDLHTGMEQFQGGKQLMSPAENPFERMEESFEGLYPHLHHFPNQQDVISKHMEEGHFIGETELRPGLIIDANSKSDLNGIHNAYFNNKEFGERSVTGSALTSKDQSQGGQLFMSPVESHLEQIGKSNQGLHPELYHIQTDQDVIGNNIAEGHFIDRTGLGSGLILDADSGPDLSGIHNDHFNYNEFNKNSVTGSALHTGIEQSQNGHIFMSPTESHLEPIHESAEVLYPELHHTSTDHDVITKHMAESHHKDETGLRPGLTLDANIRSDINGIHNVHFNNKGFSESSLAGSALGSGIEQSQGGKLFISPAESQFEQMGEAVQGLHPQYNHIQTDKDVTGKNIAERHFIDETGLGSGLILDSDSGPDLNGIHNDHLNYNEFNKNSVTGSALRTGTEQSQSGHIFMSPTESHLEPIHESAEVLYPELHHTSTDHDVITKHMAESHLIDETGPRPGLPLNANLGSDLNGIHNVHLNNKEFSESSLAGSAFQTDIKQFQGDTLFISPAESQLEKMGESDVGLQLESPHIPTDEDVISKHMAQSHITDKIELRPDLMLNENLGSHLNGIQNLYSNNEEFSGSSLVGSDLGAHMEHSQDGRLSMSSVDRPLEKMGEFSEELYPDKHHILTHADQKSKNMAEGHLVDDIRLHPSDANLGSDFNKFQNVHLNNELIGKSLVEGSALRTGIEQSQANQLFTSPTESPLELIGGYVNGIYPDSTQLSTNSDLISKQIVEGHLINEMGQHPGLILNAQVGSDLNGLHNVNLVNEDYGIEQFQGSKPFMSSTESNLEQMAESGGGLYSDLHHIPTHPDQVSKHMVESYGINGMGLHPGMILDDHSGSDLNGFQNLHLNNEAFGEGSVVGSALRTGIKPSQANPLFISHTEGPLEPLEEPGDSNYPELHQMSTHSNQISKQMVHGHHINEIGGHPGLILDASLESDLNNIHNVNLDNEKYESNLEQIVESSGGLNSDLHHIPTHPDKLSKHMAEGQDIDGIGLHSGMRLDDDSVSDLNVFHNVHLNNEAFEGPLEQMGEPGDVNHPEYNRMSTHSDQISKQMVHNHYTDEMGGHPGLILDTNLESDLNGIHNVNLDNEEYESYLEHKAESDEGLYPELHDIPNHSDLMSKHTRDGHLTDEIGLQPDLILDAKLGSDVNGIQNVHLNNDEFRESSVVGSALRTGIEQSQANLLLMPPTKGPLEQMGESGDGIYPELHQMSNHSDQISKQMVDGHHIDKIGVHPGLILDASLGTDVNGIHNVNLYNEDYGESSVIGSDFRTGIEQSQGSQPFMSPTDSPLEQIGGSVEGFYPESHHIASHLISKHVDGEGYLNEDAILSGLSAGSDSGLDINDLQIGHSPMNVGEYSINNKAYSTDSGVEGVFPQGYVLASPNINGRGLFGEYSDVGSDSHVSSEHSLEGRMHMPFSKSHFSQIMKSSEGFYPVLNLRPSHQGLLFKYMDHAGHLHDDILYYNPSAKLPPCSR